MARLKRILFDTIRSRWSHLIEEPFGFPDEPPTQQCWIWTGALKDIYPRATFLGAQINPRNLIFELHHDRAPLLKPNCGHARCINPLHQRDAGSIRSNDVPPAFDPQGIDWEQLFRDLGISRTLTPDEIINQTGAPIEAAQEWAKP